MSDLSHKKPSGRGGRSARFFSPGSLVIHILTAGIIMAAVVSFVVSPVQKSPHSMRKRALNNEDAGRVFVVGNDKCRVADFDNKDLRLKNSRPIDCDSVSAVGDGAYRYGPGDRVNRISQYFNSRN
jgi:hypothetical protein